MSVIAEGYSSESHVAFSCHISFLLQFVTDPQSFLDIQLDTTEDKGQLFCIMFLNLHLSFFLIDSEYAFYLLQEYHISDIPFVSLYPISQYII